MRSILCPVCGHGQFLDGDDDEKDIEIARLEDRVQELSTLVNDLSSLPAVTIGTKLDESSSSTGRNSQDGSISVRDETRSVTKVCEQCLDTFPWHGIGRIPRFCSPKCRKTHHRASPPPG
jgi:hypothetical protein